MERKLNVLERERKRLEKQYSIITERYAEAELTAQVEVRNPAIRRAEHLERDLWIMPVVSIPTVRA